MVNIKRHAALLGILATGAWGCTEADTYGPEFPKGSGRAPGSGVAYAPGPYGLGLGSTIADLSFIGFGQPDIYAEESDAAEIRLSHFYNPTGDDVFPEGSPLGEGNAKPRAVLFVTSASWCGPCRYEAQTILPEKHSLYEDMGGEFVLALQQGWSGAPATIGDVQEWADDFDLDYPAVGDPPSRLFQYTGQGAFPGMVMVRTKDMKITRIRVGAVACEAIGDPVSRSDCFELWDTFEAIMADEEIEGIDD